MANGPPQSNPGSVAPGPASKGQRAELIARGYLVEWNALVCPGVLGQPQDPLGNNIGHDLVGTPGNTQSRCSHVRALGHSRQGVKVVIPKRAVRDISSNLAIFL